MFNLDRSSRDIRRTRKIYKALQFPKKGKIIDVSCGGGRLLKNIENNHPQLELFGVDITPGFLALHPELSKINFATANADELPYPEHAFNISICSLSLHHYKNINAVLKEIKHITKPDGKIYLIDILPQSKLSQWLYNIIGCHEPYHFEKFYNLTELISLLKNLRLQVEQVSTINFLPKIQVLKIRNK